MPILESMTLFDLRPRDLNFEHKAITHDKLEITFHVTLTWQPYVEDLQMVLDANIQQERKLRTLAEHQLTHEVSKKSLAEVQSNVRVLAFHLQRFVGEPESRLEGARKYGMYLQEAKITKIDLPAEIIELNKTEKLTELRKKYGPTQPGISAG